MDVDYMQSLWSAAHIYPLIMLDVIWYATIMSCKISEDDRAAY
jgi:hypothetical protein